MLPRNYVIEEIPNAPRSGPAYRLRFQGAELSTHFTRGAAEMAARFHDSRSARRGAGLQADGCPAGHGGGCRCHECRAARG